MLILIQENMHGQVACIMSQIINSKTWVRLCNSHVKILSEISIGTQSCSQWISIWTSVSKNKMSLLFEDLYVHSSSRWHAQDFKYGKHCLLNHVAYVTRSKLFAKQNEELFAFRKTNKNYTFISTIFFFRKLSWKFAFNFTTCTSSTLEN